MNRAVRDLVNIAMGDKQWIEAASARTLCLQSGTDIADGSYTLLDAVVDDKKSDEEQKRASTLVLLEDSLVHGVRLAAAEHESLETSVLVSLLELAAACEIDIARARTANA